MKQIGFFTEEDRLSKLSVMGDPLEKMTGAVDFEKFRPLLNKIFQKEALAPGGRPPWDYVLMFKVILLQQWYSIADDMTEYLINDRLSFQRFLGLSLWDKVPDAKTIWLFRENITEGGYYAGVMHPICQVGIKGVKQPCDTPPQMYSVPYNLVLNANSLGCNNPPSY